MHVKFQVAGFQKKGKYVIVLLISPGFFLLGHLPVQVTLWFLAHDISEITDSMEEFRHIN